MKTNEKVKFLSFSLFLFTLLIFPVEKLFSQLPGCVNSCDEIQVIWTSAEENVCPYYTIPECYVCAKSGGCANVGTDPSNCVKSTTLDNGLRLIDCAPGCALLNYDREGIGIGDPYGKENSGGKLWYCQE